MNESEVFLILTLYTSCVYVSDGYFSGHHLWPVVSLVVFQWWEIQTVQTKPKRGKYSFSSRCFSFLQIIVSILIKIFLLIYLGVVILGWPGLCTSVKRTMNRSCLLSPMSWSAMVRFSLIQLEFYSGLQN